MKPACVDGVHGGVNVGRARRWSHLPRFRCSCRAVRTAVADVSLRMVLLVSIVAKTSVSCRNRLASNGPVAAIIGQRGGSDDSVFQPARVCSGIDLEEKQAGQELMRCRYCRNCFCFFFSLIGQFAVLLVHILSVTKQFAPLLSPATSW